MKAPFQRRALRCLLFAVPFGAGPITWSAQDSEPAAGLAREVAFEGAGGLELHGTLALPESAPESGAPAFLLLPGSGPTDRDGNQPPLIVTDLLKQVAGRLAAEGIATLRFDKRSAARYQLRILAMDVEEQNDFLSWDSFLGDAIAAVRFLREQDGIDAGRVGLFGHSEGGLIALHVARDARPGARPWGLVLAGTSGTNLADVLRHQIGLALAGAPEARDEFLAGLERAIEAVLAGRPVPADLPTGLDALFPANALKLLAVELAADPTELAKGVRGPVLLLHGASDKQVPAEESTQLLKAAFDTRPQGSCVVLIAKLTSHDLKPVKGVIDPGFQGDVTPAVMNQLAMWVRQLP
ncbi:MAG: alpha/beta fold hydrolase [Planctomycetota bacterium]|nr:MAG: alpha/beta fold hydrolase [Planctomycetota bacterium]